MTVQEKLYTAREIMALSATEDSQRYELSKGRLIIMSPTGDRHGEIANEIAFRITAHVKANKLGRVHSAETGFLLTENPDTVRAPDVAFTSKARASARTDGYSSVAPDLAVEVVSPGNTQTEMHEKVVEYFAAGTRMVWIVYLKSRAIYCYTSAQAVTILSASDNLGGNDVLPGFSVRVSDIFAVLDE